MIYLLFYLLLTCMCALKVPVQQQECFWPKWR